MVRRHLELIAGSVALILFAPSFAAAAAPAGDPLAAGWLRHPNRAELRLALGKTALRDDWRRAIPAAMGGTLVSPVASESFPSAGVLAIGDALSISQDDDFSPAPAFGWEGRLAARAGTAGSSDFLAFRVAAQQFAYGLPVNVTGATLGFDNRYGRTTWPLLGLKSESATSPLQPEATFLAQISAFATPSTALPAIVSAPGPDAFQRLPLTFSTPVTVSWTPTINDGMWSDGFDRAVDENLDHPASDWSECDLTTCGLNTRLTIKSMRVVKSLAGDAIGVKFPAASVISRRPIADLDGVLSVDYDVSAASAGAAGMFFRLESLDRFYFVEYRKGTNEIALSAMTPGGFQSLRTVTAPGTPVTGNLRVDVRGAHPSVAIEVRLGATSLFTHTDSTYAYAGVLRGVGNFGGTTGEVWDNFQVLRQPDLFVVAQIPPGLDAGLPAEWSPETVGFGNVLASTDGVTFSNIGPGSNCLRAPNGYVQLQVASDTNLFQIESKLVELGISCPTCLDTRNMCAEDLGPDDIHQPVFEVNQPLQLSAGWWNEHAPDESFLTLEFQLWRGGFSDPGAVLVDFQDVAVGLTPGQRTSGQAVLNRVSAPLTFSPTVAGDYCAWVIELYNRNGDSCYDGYEGSPCPIGCTCVTDPDQNAATGVLTRALRVVLPCVPLTLSEIVPTSLRVAEDPSDATRTLMQWSVSGSAFRLFNIQMTTSKPELAEPDIRDRAPTFTRLLGGMPDTNTIQSLPAVAGGVLYFAVFQNDGCASGWSLQDP